MIYAAKNKVIDARFGDKQVLGMYLGDAKVYELPAYAVECTFTNVTSDAPASVYDGDTLSVTLTVASGYKMQESSVVVTMGGVDITSTAYNSSNKTITISNVTGDVSITATAEIWYVENGLIFHLDGIKKGATADAWTDLIGGYIFTKTGDVVATDKGWSLGGTTSDYLLCTSQEHPVGQNLTVEVCFKPERTGNEMIFGTCNRTANKALFYKKGSELLFMQDNNTYTYETVADTKYTISLSQANGFVNMQSIEKDSTTDFITFAVNNRTYIGVRRTTSNWYAPFNGEIYAIRIYNRQLTRDEIIQNQTADNVRFGLGIT